MSKLKIKELKQALGGEVDFGLNTQQEVVNKIFGIAEDTATVPDYDARGETVGVTEMVTKRHLIAEAVGDFNAIGSEAVGRELMGRDFYRQCDKACADPGFFPRIKALMGRPKKIGESVQADTASLYEPINTWGSFVLGLYDHKILQGYDAAPRIMDRLVPDMPTMVHGAQKHTLHDYDGSLPSYDGLGELVEEDTARGVPAWVWSQAIKEFGLQYAITMEALKSDIDGGLGRRGEQIGMAMSKLENYRAGSVFFGYDNRYCFNTINNAAPSCNTFLSASDTGTGYTAAAPFNYENKFYSVPLLTVDSLVTQYIKMLQLQAPVTNWRMDLGESFYLVCSETMKARALQIVHSIRDFLAAVGGIAPTATNIGRTSESDNVLRLRNLDIEVVSFGQEWKDVLTGGTNAGTSNAGFATAGTQNLTSNGPPATWSDYKGQKADATGTSANGNANPLTQSQYDQPYTLMSNTNGLCTVSTDTTGSADNVWFLLSKKGRYMQRDVWIPPQPRTFLLSGTDMARRIGMRGDVIHATRFVVLEPRYAQCNLPHASGVQ